MKRFLPFKDQVGFYTLDDKLITAEFVGSHNSVDYTMFAGLRLSHVWVVHTMAAVVFSLSAVRFAVLIEPHVPASSEHWPLPCYGPDIHPAL